MPLSPTLRLRTTTHLRTAALTPTLNSSLTKIPNYKQPHDEKSRNVIWFNPPYSRNVKTNVGRNFFALVDKHFPASNKLRKIFNKNTLKVSYCCIGNMKNIVNKHNASTLNKDKMNNNESY